MKKFSFFIFFFTLIFFAKSTYATALSKNKFQNQSNKTKIQKIYIFSDKAKFDIPKRHMIYQGHVLIISPYFNATCQKADVFLDENFNPKYIYGYKNVILENDNFYIKAQFFFYDAVKEKIYLKDKVKITIKDIKKLQKQKEEKLNAKS